MRFRKYLGGHYQDSGNIYQDSEGGNHPRPIFSIYFLGHNLSDIASPVVWVKRGYYDVTTQERLEVQNEFIESLTHDSIVVQIPKLAGKRRTDLEMMLSLFDQSRRDPENQHYIEVEEGDFPAEFLPMIRRLVQAAAEKEVCRKMELEDELISDLANMERSIAAKERIIQEKEEVIHEKDNVIQEKTRALEENARALEKTRRVAIEALVKTGIPEEEARKMILGQGD
jgi:hypothetical protein